MVPFTHSHRYRAIWITKVHVFIEAMDFLNKSRSCACPRGAGACSNSSCHEPEKPAADSFQVEYLPPSKTRRRHRTRECCCDERRECFDCSSSRQHYRSDSRARDDSHPGSTIRTQIHSCRARRRKKTTHFNDVSSSSSSESESEIGSDDDAQCEKLKVKFPLAHLPAECHPQVRAADCLPSTYYGIFQPVRPLGPIFDSRDC